MNRLGDIYLIGIEVPKDYTESLKWYRMAADKGVTISMMSLAAMYDGGLGTARDPIEAVYWRGQAAIHGFPGGMSFLADTAREGKDMPQDCGLAHYWYTRAVAAGDKDAEEFLTGDVLCPPQTPPIGGPSADELAAKAEAASKAGQDVVSARLLRLAADKGSVSAMVSLGICYTTGMGVPKSQAMAMVWFTMAEEKGDPSAAAMVASYFSGMFGGIEDCPLAKEWLEKSVAAGNNGANAPLEARVYGSCRW
jgi:TPR repeat protein